VTKGNYHWVSERYCFCGDSTKSADHGADYGMIEIHLGAIVQGCLIHQMSIGKAVELKLASVAK
jgi:hypothetical protein